MQTLQSLWHPLDDNISNCVAALYMHSEVKSSWVSLPCNRTHKSRALCALDVSQPRRENMTSNHSTLMATESLARLNQSLHCKPNYIMFRQYCYTITVVSSTPLPLKRRNFHASSPACADWYIPPQPQHLDFINTIANYILFSISSVRTHELQTKTTSCFVSMSCSPIVAQRWTEVEELASCELSPVRLEIEPSLFGDADTCPLGTYRCQTGTCISELYHCDGDKDCEDGSDEVKCPVQCHWNVLLASEFEADCHQCHPHNCSCSYLQYQCHSGGCIAADYLCDYTDHCEDASDERYCNYPPCISDSQFDCGQGQCIHESRVCDMVVDCQNHRDETNSQCPESLCNGHRCLTGKCIPKSWVNDLHPDCPGPFTDDEPELVAHPTDGSFRCHGNQLPCLMFHSKCYPADLYCVYDLDTHGHLYPCRNGGHLHMCSDVSCQEKYKCPDSYCIPTHRVCDGVADCPNGQDEMNCENRTCPGLIKCKQSGLCVHRNNLHNNHRECSGSNEDEMLRREECPSDCICQSSAVTCKGDLESLPELPSKTKILILSQNKLRLNVASFSRSGELRILDLSSNEIEHIENEAFSTMSNLVKLDLSDNQIAYLKAGHFLGLDSVYFLNIKLNPLISLNYHFAEGMSVLPVLELQQLSLFHIEGGAFIGAGNVLRLNLSYNVIQELHLATFSGLVRLKVLDLRHNPLMFIKPNAFSALVSLAMFYTDLHKLCCMQGNNTWCSTRESAVSSCAGLLGKLLFKTGTWILGSFTVIGNLWVITHQTKRLGMSKQTQSVSLQGPFLFINMASSDMLYGLYLLILGAADVYFNESFLRNEDVWENSFTCTVIGILAATSLDMSLCVLVLLSLDQAHVVLAGFYYGYIGYHISMYKIATTLSFCWVVLTSFAITHRVMSTTGASDDYSQALCLATILHSRYSDSVLDYLVLAVLIFRLIACGLIVLSYTAIATINLRVSRGIQNSKSRRNTPYAKISLIIFTNVAVSFTHSVIVLLSHVGQRPNKNVILWLVTFLLPLNALVNPYLNSWQDLRSQLSKIPICINGVRFALIKSLRLGPQDGQLP